MSLRRIVEAALALSLVLPAAAAAQEGASCDSVTMRTALGDLSGEPIRKVRVTTLSLPSTSGLAGVMDRLHVRTREATVRGHLLFAAGDTVDTLRLAESLRRLRSLRYLGDARITARHCGEAPGVDLDVTTRDVWSTKATLQMGSSSASFVAVTERNLLGSGREATLSVRSDRSRIGVGAALKDPWFLNSGLEVNVGTNSYGDGNDWIADVRSRERSILEPTRAELTYRREVRLPPEADGDAVDRGAVVGLVTRRAAIGWDAVTGIEFGGEAERTALRAAGDAALVGPERVQRSFVGVDLGIDRRSVAYDTLTWLLPHGLIIDVPLALEGEGIVAIGRDAIADAGALHLDAWSGRVWLPSRSSLLIGDAWASGYAIGGRVSAATLRGSLRYLRAAPRGVWSLQLAMQRLTAPDPDLRAMSLFDPTLAALPDSQRLAQTVLAGSVERDFWVRAVSHSWAVGLDLFLGGSTRWDPARAAGEQVSLGVVGLGINLVPSRADRSMARIDIGIPFAVGGTPRRGFYVGTSIVPLLGIRQRDGRRSF